MGAKNWLGSVGVIIITAACDQGSTSSAVFAADPPEVGDSIDGGHVTNVSGNECRVVTVTFEPEWTCSAEQMDLARGVSAGGMLPSGAAAAPAPETEQVKSSRRTAKDSRHGAGRH